MNSLMMLAILTVGQLQVDDIVLVPRTELRTKTILVPKTVVEEHTVYDRYRLRLIPEDVVPSVELREAPLQYKYKSKTKFKFFNNPWRTNR